MLNDEDSVKTDELAILAGQKSIVNNPNKPPDVWFNFYEKMRYIREYHKKFTAKINPSNSPESFLKASMMAPFT